MNKYLKIAIGIVLSLIIIGIGVFVAYKIYNDNNVNQEITGEDFKVTNNTTEPASSTEVKLSPNADFIIENEYSDCEHIIENELELPKELVNKTQGEVEQIYKDYNLISFSKDKVVLSKLINGKCKEHYKIKIEDGVIVVYNFNEDGKEVLFDKTGIGVEYITDVDLNRINEGLEFNNLEELNQYLEDFE